MSLKQGNADDNSSIPAFFNGTSQDVVTGAASAQSAAVGVGTRAVRLCCTVACRYLVGANPTALAASTLLPANWIEFVMVTPGDKIAAIQDAAAGKLNITELA